MCGDVGFGKTEVAMRAMYIAVLAGRQVWRLTVHMCYAHICFIYLCAGGSAGAHSGLGDAACPHPARTHARRQVRAYTPYLLFCLPILYAYTI